MKKNVERMSSRGKPDELVRYDWEYQEKWDTWSNGDLFKREWLMLNSCDECEGNEKDIRYNNS